MFDNTCGVSEKGDKDNGSKETDNLRKAVFIAKWIGFIMRDVCLICGRVAHELSSTLARNGSERGGTLTLTFVGFVDCRCSS